MFIYVSFVANKFKLYLFTRKSYLYILALLKPFLKISAGYKKK